MQFPGGTALIPGYKLVSRTLPHNFSSAAVIWQADNSLSMPPGLVSFLTRTYNIVPTEYPVRSLQHRYKYGRSETVKFAVIQFPLPASPGQ
jgi:hypothetical protein